MTRKNVKLKELLTQPVQNGYSPNCPETPNGRWILGLGALNGHGLDIKQIKPAPPGDKKVDDFKLKPGDFLVSRSNTFDKVGRSALFKGELENCSYPDLIMRFRVDEAVIYPEFLELYLRSSEAVRHFQRSASGTSESMVKINKAVLENLVVPMPPHSEQRAVADLLSTWNLALEKSERLIAVKEKQFTWLLNQLIPNRAKQKNWKEAKLGSIATMSSGGTPKSTIGEYYDGEIPWVSISDMTLCGMYIEKTNRRLTKLGLEKSAAKIFPSGTVLYAMYASIGECSIARVPMSSSQAILGIQVSHHLINEFLYFYLLSTKNRVRLQGQQGTQSNLNAQMVKELMLPLPPRAEQIRICNFLNGAQHEINLIKNQTEWLRTQMHWLMKKLLTGEWQVRIPPLAATR